MCGITGIMAFNEIGRFHMINLSEATDKLAQRGPDGRGIFNTERIGLGHRRLAIIDTTSDGNQPMSDESKRYTIVFNGEIFNFKELKKELIDKGISFFSNSDTEVLLKLFILEKEKCLTKLNGFFSFAIYDQATDQLIIARDRYGIKPLLYYSDEDKFLFSSEMKSLLAYGIAKDIDYVSLYQYLQVNYIPYPNSIFKHVQKLQPGHYLTIEKRKVVEKKYYTIPYEENRVIDTSISYEKAQEQLALLLDDSVQKRLISDVPLGSFLSGGIDSSVIAALASRHTPHLNTFSIGYKDEPFFDETSYANLVAKKLGTNHTVFSLTNHDLLEHVFQILDYIDEPFADSSAIPTFILSRQTRKHVTVALSGDGADELFGGYNKHLAEYKIRSKNLSTQVLKTISPLAQLFPKSRNSFLTNKARQLDRFAKGAKLSPADRYWRWSSYADEQEALDLFYPYLKSTLNKHEYKKRKKIILQHLTNDSTLNDVFLSDIKLGLPNDMLTKVDLMSMANSLEVRVPFLDYRVVNFAFSLPVHYKIDNKMKKKIVQDAFRNLLPKELYNRPKQGFEVPLLKWFRHELKSLITNDLLDDTFIKEQGLFNLENIQQLKKKLNSKNPEDVHAQIWGLIVFQYWWKKYM